MLPAAKYVSLSLADTTEPWCISIAVDLQKLTRPLALGQSGCSTRADPGVVESWKVVCAWKTRLLTPCTPRDRASRQ